MPLDVEFRCDGDTIRGHQYSNKSRLERLAEGGRKFLVENL